MTVDERGAKNLAGPRAIWNAGLRFESALSHLNYLFGCGLLIKKMLTSLAFSKPAGKYIVLYIEINRGLAGWKGFEPLADGLRVHRSACLSYQPVLKPSHNYIIIIYTFRRMCMKHCYALKKNVEKEPFTQTD